MIKILSDIMSEISYFIKDKIKIDNKEKFSSIYFIDNSVESKK